MKKVILSLIAVALSGSALMAQTNSAAANNTITVNETGYAYNFGGTNGNNGKGSFGIADFTGVDDPGNQVWNVDSTGHLIVDVPVMTSYNGNLQRMKFYKGEGVAAPIDLSATANQNFKIKLNSPMIGEMVLAFYNGAQSSYGTDAVVLDLVAGDNTFTVTDFNLKGITDSSTVNGLGFLFRGLEWGDPNFTGKVTIDYILVGDAISNTLAPKLSVKEGNTAQTPVNSGDLVTLDEVLAGEDGDVLKLKLINSGPAVLSVSDISLTGTDASEFTLSGSVTSVGETKIDSSLTIAFTPSAGAVAGSVKTATITITSNSSTNSTYTISLSATVATPTSVQAAIDNSLISVYPNPAKDQINIDLSAMNTSAASVKVMNANGMVVYEGTSNSGNETINTSSFNKGIYLVQVSSANKVSNKKIVIE